VAIELNETTWNLLGIALVDDEMDADFAHLT